MQDRLTRLEEAVKKGKSQHADELVRMQELHQVRVEGLLMTITGQEDCVDALERMSVTTDYAAVVKR